MGTSSSSAEQWPQDAAPRHWVAALFEKMTRMWGNTFLDRWRDVDLEGVMQEWGKGLKKLSNAELKAGVDGLMMQKYPPSLPDFYASCKMRRLVEVAQQPVITDNRRADPNEVQANLKRMREALAPLSQPKEISDEWAYRLLMKDRSGADSSLPYEVVCCASDAITSSAGRRVVEECADPELKAEYQTIRDEIVRAYRAASKPLWETP